jgi:hypothetical protein
MPSSKFIRVGIDDRELELGTGEPGISISYMLEDPDNFQNKKASEARKITVPATVNNDGIANTFHNPGIDDSSVGSVYRSFRRAFIEANGHEIVVGKAMLRTARYTNKPTEYDWDFYGNNGDWIIDLKEATLFDYLQHINFTFTKSKIFESWGYDGTDEALAFVFAPVRYGVQMDNYVVDPNAEPQADKNMKPEYMRPALSKYWIIYWAFKSLGYRVSSDFFDSEYFRRQVMPWTWGNFLYSDGTRLNNLDFLAKSTETVSMLNQRFTGYWDVKASNDSTNGAFDNNGVYNYVAPAMNWTYLPAFNYGSLEGTFHLNMAVTAVATANSDVELRVQWFKNGVRIPNGNDNGNGTELVNLHAPSPGRRDFVGSVDDWFTILVDPGDVITAKIYLHTFDSGLGIARIHASVDAFELDYFRIPLGGLIDFQNYTGLKKYKFLDFLRGIVDEFNLSVNTDPVNKVVTFEPTHPYSLTNDLSVKVGGYFNGHTLNWEDKQDLSKTSSIDLFCEAEREFHFKYKDDGNDGILKIVQDRFITTIGQAKYVFPDRFQAGVREIENRFFSPVMHYDVEQWKGLGTAPGDSPQMICIVPENISNTSREEAQNTFEPKSAYYKGIVTDVGWIFDNEIQHNFPFMFAVNYRIGGETDPVLSYSDERIGRAPDAVLAKGLLKRFFWQRVAIMRNGQYHTTSFLLNNLDIANFLHREHIVCRGQKWELVEIRGYKPYTDQSTECFLRKWAPISIDELNNTYPSASTVLDLAPVTGKFDTKYSPMKCLFSDIKLTQ